jgi:hypothetical protein
MIRYYSQRSSWSTYGSSRREILRVSAKRWKRAGLTFVLQDLRECRGYFEIFVEMFGHSVEMDDWIDCRTD